MSLVGDPTLVATGLPNQVALLALANSTGTPNVDVVMAISNDGGNSFGNLTLISDGTSDATSQGCVAAPQSLDQPKLVMEKGGANVAWAYWNAKQLSAQFCSEGTYWNPYVRRIQFTNVAPFASLGGVRDVNDGFGGSVFGDRDADRSHWGNIAANVDGSSHEILTFVWADVDNLPPATNSSTTPCNGNIPAVDVTWEWAVFDATSSTWLVSDADLMARDSVDPTCVVVGIIAKNNMNQTLRPIVISDEAALNVHVFVSGSKYFNDDPSIVGGPKFRGTRIRHSVINLPTLSVQVAAEEISPVTQVAGSCANCLQDCAHGAGDECFVEQFAVSAEFNDSTGEMAVAWHDTRLSPNVLAAAGYPPGTGIPAGAPLTGGASAYWDAPMGRSSRNRGVAGDFLNQPVEQLAVFTGGGSVPWNITSALSSSGGDNTPWGDYEAMAADQVDGDFYPFWGDHRNGNVAQQFTTDWQPRTGFTANPFNFTAFPGGICCLDAVAVPDEDHVYGLGNGDWPLNDGNNWIWRSFHQQGWVQQGNQAGTAIGAGIGMAFGSSVPGPYVVVTNLAGQSYWAQDTSSLNFQELPHDSYPVQAIDFGGSAVLGVDATYGPFGSVGGSGAYITMASFGWAGQQLWQRLRTPATNLSNELWAPITMPSSTRCSSAGFKAKKIVTTGTASWAIDICGDIWTTQDTSQGWRDLSVSDGSCAQDIAVGPEWRDAIVVGCGAPGVDAQIWHFTGTSWQGDNGSGVAVAASKKPHLGSTYGKVYVVNAAHQLWVNTNFP